MSYFTHEGLTLRPVERGDLDRILRLRNGQSTWTHLTDPRPIYEKDQDAWFASLSRAGAMYFIASAPNQPFVGLIRMDEHDRMNLSIRVGADVDVPLRGQGYGKRIYKSVLKYCFHTLNLHRVWLEVLKTNKIALKLYRGQGFKVEGRLREAVFRDGGYVDYVVMSILEGEYRG